MEDKEIKKMLDLIEKAILQAETKKDFRICENALLNVEKELSKFEKQNSKMIFRTYEKSSANAKLKRLVRE